jgi:pimeloyl-ACP methyl ester carboxylesterase
VIDPIRSVEDTVHHYFQPVHWSVATGVPINYVLNQRGGPVPPATHEEMAQRLPQPVPVVRVDSGHLLPVIAPDSFAEILSRIPA